MKTFKLRAAQGDLYFEKITALPKGVVAVSPDAGRCIIGHSETGHHHVMEARAVEMYRLPEEIYECFLAVKEPTELTHLRSFDTHEPILFDKGVYRVRRQRQAIPGGWERAPD